jgi:hypothetical protein
MNPRELPIACSLDAEGLGMRQAELAVLGRGLVEVSPAGETPVVLRFIADADTRTSLDRIVAAEAECCPFLAISVRGGDTLELTIDGPDDAAPVIAELTQTIAGGR